MQLPLITHRHREIQLSELRKELSAHLRDGPLSPLAIFRHKEIAGFLLTPTTYLNLLWLIADVNEEKPVRVAAITPRVRASKTGELWVKPYKTGRFWAIESKHIDQEMRYKDALRLNRIWEALNADSEER